MPEVYKMKEVNCSSELSRVITQNRIVGLVITTRTVEKYLPLIDKFSNSIYSRGTTFIKVPAGVFGENIRDPAVIFYLGGQQVAEWRGLMEFIEFVKTRPGLSQKL